MKTVITKAIAASILAVVLVNLPSNAITIEEVPNPRKVNGSWVTDMADILDDKTEVKLNQMISELEAKKGTEIAVVTVENTSPSDSTKQFTTALFNYWGIGKKAEDNGILFLISGSDRRVEIETGYGIETILTDEEVANIIDSKIVPNFKQGDFDDGTLNGVRPLIEELDGKPDIPWKTLLGTVFVWCLGTAGLMFVGMGKRGNKRNERGSSGSYHDYYHYHNGGGYGGGGGSSGGGSDFGGGSSDGGGAGDSW